MTNGRITKLHEARYIRLDDAQARERWDLRRGEDLPFAVFEEVLDLHRGDPRERSTFDTVMYTWRRRFFRATRVNLSALPGFGFHVDTDVEQFRHGVSGVRVGVRKVNRSFVVTVSIDPEKLGEGGKRRLEFVLAHGDRVAKAGRQLLRGATRAELPPTGSGEKL